MKDRRRPLLVALAAAAVLTLAAGCTGEAEPAADADAETQQVIAPAGPGEPARTISPEEAREAAQEGAEPNAADFRFMRMMIAHHEQALVMSELVDDRTREESVRRLADRITAAQNGEIAAMEAWLTRNAGAAADEDREGHGGHGADPMPGMATPEQLEALEAAEGADFDALFLELMITHHQGAVTMATDALTQGNDGLAQQLANDVMAEQSVEIDRMEAMR